jgi:outer membrane protein OmpA-like peptidoglycan-associated protein
MMKNIKITLLVILLANLIFAQDIRIKSAENYFNLNRFADAKIIYQELCLKDKINVNTYSQVYRNAAFSGLKVKDYWFVLSIYESFIKSSDFNFDDAYNYFMLENYLGRYEKFEDIFDLDVVKNGSGPKKDLLNQYQKQKPWEKLMQDTTSSVIQYLDFNSGKGDFSPLLHPEGMSFSSYRKDNGQVSVYDNLTFTNQFIFYKDSKKIKELKAISEKKHDGAAFYHAENKTWYYSKNLTPLKNNQVTKIGIYIYNEETKTEIGFPFNSNDYFVAQPFVTKDGLTMYFSSDMPGGIGKSDIWKSKYIDGTWSQPENLGAEINTIEDEMFPYIFENDFYFSSNGHLGLGGLDVFVASFKNEKFGTIQNLAYPFNSFGDDFSPVLVEDGERGYYTNNRKDYKFVDNIYRFKLNNKSVQIRGVILANTIKKEPLKGIKVVVRDENNIFIDTLESDENGIIDFKAKKEKSYTFLALGNDDFDEKNEVISTFNLQSSDTIKKDILLNLKSVLVNVTIKDKISGELIEGANVEFKSPQFNNAIQSNSKGLVSVKIPRDLKLDLSISKKNYLDKLDEFSTKTLEKIIEKEVLLEKLTAGTTFKIENVFYDLGKATLRPESKIELDKLAEFLVKNDNVKVELSSHTDSRGSDASNQKLSQARAQSCVDYLLTKGINTSNIVAKGYGETKLVNKCKNNVKCSEEEHQANRRTEIKILSVK